MRFSEFSSVYNMLWLCMIVAQSALFVKLAAFPGKKMYPCFRAFIAFCCVRSAILFPLWMTDHNNAYFRVYYAAEFLSLFVMAAVLWEIFNELFISVRIIPPGVLHSQAFWGATATFAAIALYIFFPGKQAEHVLSTLRSLDRSFMLLQTALFAILIIFSTKLNLPMRKRLYGIIIGFTFHLGIEFAASFGKLSGTSIVVHWLNYLKTSSFLIAIVIWFVTFVLPEPTTTKLTKIQEGEVFSFMEDLRLHSGVQ